MTSRGTTARGRKRSVAQLRALVDAAQIAVFVGFLVDLGLPWWTQTDSTFEKAGTFTGWGSLGAGSGTSGLAWLNVIGMILALAAAPFRRRWASLTAAVLGLLAALGSAIDVANAGDVGHAHVGIWTGCLLLVLAAGLDLAEAQLGRQPGG